MSIGRLLKQTVTIANPGGLRGKHGEAIAAAGADFPARFQRTRRTILNANSEREPIDAIVFVAPDAAVELGAKITYSSQAYKLMRIDDVPGRNGSIHHRELLVQLWSFST